MAKCADKKTALQRSGTSQKERLLPAMQEGYVQVDERSYADWIVFSQAFAGYVQYYDSNNEINGNWTAFFNSDLSAIIGTIAVQDVSVYKRQVQERFDYLKNGYFPATLDKASGTLYELFSIAFSFCAKLDELYRILPDDTDFKPAIANLIKTSLQTALSRLLSYYKAAVDLNYLQPHDMTGLKVLGGQVVDASLVVETIGLSELWYKNAVSWNDYYQTVIQKDESIFGDAAFDTYFGGQFDPATGVTAAEWLQYMKMKHAANHNLFAGIFDLFLSGYSKLVNHATKELLQTLEKRNTHPAHYALFLAFLRLFRLAQQDINSITRRHLDLYYKEILRLAPKAALPNSAHIIAELAKQVNEHLLPADSLLKAGKDSDGKEVLYGLDAETSFNKASVKSLHAVFLSAPDLSADTTLNNRLYAAPQVNSGDGMGADLTTENKEWHPISHLVYLEDEVTDVKMPLAEIGFAVASHYLYLQEGARKIMLRLGTTNNAAIAGKQYRIYLTTEKEWYEVSAPVSVVTNNNLNNGTEGCVEFSFTLSGDEPPITNYNPKVHGTDLQVSVPVIKLLLINKPGQAYLYKALRDVRINKFDIKVEVGMETSAYNQQGLKQLQVSTDAGVVDTSKPFMPFGGQPKKDAGIVIGSKEIFSKKNAAVKLNIEWAGLPASMYDINYNTTYYSVKQSNGTYYNYSNPYNSPYYPKVKPQFLVDGIWSVVDGNGAAMASTDIFSYNNPTVQVFNPSKQLPSKTIASYEDEYSYNSKSVNGFIRLVLDGDFGHKKYLSDQTEYLLEKNNSVYYPKSVGVAPIEPYSPVVQSLYISYTAYSDVVNLNDTTESAWQNKDGSLFHLYPFGYAEQHAYIDQQNIHYLLPQFTHPDEDLITIHHEGEFYIGFDHLQGQQSVNVLFQVLDGSADPRISKPEEHIHWDYLSKNKWMPFNKQDISDATLQLIQSGIISFTIPAAATTNNTILPAGLLWIRAAVAAKPEAICKLLTVEAQAAVSSFEDHGNATDFLNNPLPAGSISKLKTPQSAIKKITQPYASFGGRARESSDAFYVRVSERLRHKARAITIWDYEHLVLEAFPAIYKVKCLNHTLSNGDYNEVLPGHVTIISIPDLKLRNDVNPLKPYTSQALLKQVEAFIKKRISCHVKLHVVNPVFEEVKMSFKLRLRKEYRDFSIYSKKLQEEITNYLSPWAYSNEADISFGGSIYKSALIDFIEERPYVDFITDVVMTHISDKGVIIQTDNDQIIASTARSILVSVAAGKHEITEIPDQAIQEPYECEWLQQQTVSGKQ